MIPRTLFKPEHEAFRRSARRFFEQDVVPHRERWEEQQHVDREVWKRAGQLGLLCLTMPEEYGGAGADRLFSAVLMEEQMRAGDSCLGFAVHSDIVANYLNHFGDDAQKRQWLPKMAAGDVIGAIAMTEPGTGSDLQAIRTTALADGEDYLVDGAKTFITNGYLCDLVIVVVKTGDASGGAENVSLVLVEADRPGFSKGKPLKKIGMKGQDTCELFFERVRVPRSNLLGEEGMGFVALMKELAWERLIIAVNAIAAAEYAFAATLDYVRTRKVFGKPVANYQHTRFKLAELKAEIAIGRVFIDRCLEQTLAGELSVEAAATAKYWSTDLQGKVMDECLQLHGGYGYMLDYPIARAWVDSRAQRIYGGTNEIMKELIARSL